MKSPHFFTANPSLKTVNEYLQSVIQKMAKEKPPVVNICIYLSLKKKNINC